MHVPGESHLDKDHRRRFDERISFDCSVVLVKLSIRFKYVSSTISIIHSYKLFQSIKLGEVKTRDEMNDIVKDINEIKSQLPALIQSSQQSQSQSLNELKSELKSLKSLLLSRQSSTGASNINSNGNGNISPSSSIQIGKPSIPAWQLANNNPTTNNDKDNKDHEK